MIDSNNLLKIMSLVCNLYTNSQKKNLRFLGMMDSLEKHGRWPGQFINKWIQIV